MRRTRRKYTWFPVIGGDQSDEGEAEAIILSSTTRSIVVNNDGNLAFDVFPIIPDEPKEEAQAGDSLVDYIGTSWFIKRIVGKLHVSYTQNSQQPTGSGGSNCRIPPAVIVTAGFFVARVDAGDTSAPIGDNVDANVDYGPHALATQREPWIWRRQWLLGNNTGVPLNTGIFLPGQFYPASNASRSVADGPHVDAKTARRSQNDERLWFSMNSIQMPSADRAEIDGEVVYTLDVRVLGSIRKQKNRSAF